MRILRRPAAPIIGFVLLCATARAADAPQKISIAPANDLSAIAHKPSRGSGSGVSVCFGAGKDSVHPTREYLDGYRTASLNAYQGKRNLLVVDDGKTTHPGTDKATGLSVIVLTNARATRELLDLVEGYNAAMRFNSGRRKKP